MNAECLSTRINWWRDLQKRYNLMKLVYYEVTEDVQSAIRREKQLKNWHSDWKINLINQFNPGWNDLSEGF